MHFPAGQGCDADFFAQLKSERVVTRKREGRPYRVWILPSGRRNEALDCAVLALAARLSIRVRLEEAPDLPPSPPPLPAPEPPPSLALPDLPPTPAVARTGVRHSQIERSAGWFSGRGRGWFDRR